MTPVADRWPEERIFYRSDHYNLPAREYRCSSSPAAPIPTIISPATRGDRLDTEKAARVVRLLFHLTRTIANDSAPPRWTSRLESP